MIREGRYSIGDCIEFYDFGIVRSGSIKDIGKYGYWVRSTSGGWVRCSFDKANEFNGLIMIEEEF